MAFKGTFLILYKPWTPESHLAFMDSLNITHTVLSITAPGTHLVPSDDKLAKVVTREANDYMSLLCMQHPSRFSFFASLPLPNIEDSLSEIEYAAKAPGFKGFSLMTNAHGIYLGDPHFDPIFSALNKIHAIVFIHPTNCHHVASSNTDVNIVNPLAGLPASMLEYIFDSTRCITSLLLSATPQRFPNLTFVVPHCGSTLTATLARISGFSTRMLKTKLPGATDLQGMKKVLKDRFHFDLAGFVMPDQLEGVLSTGLGGGEGNLEGSRLLYGTDYPYMNKEVLGDLATELDAGLSELFEERESSIEGIYMNNAKKLLGL